ncbi:MAG: PQQ-binding-like beta-propeller repeat protein [Planctomycetes bacterium]|nr:PQQ-binding-like beta-propeller repeat protein [Planctomycetota bacterium]
MNSKKRGYVGLLICWLWLCIPADAADWPTWRHDANRSAATAESLPDELHLQWARELPPYRLAWPNEPRLQFDPSYEPVIMGKTLFLGSPCDGSVAAFDTETGKEKWRFYTEGPVRLAPVAWEGKVYVGSDDGYLYCLSAEDGSLRWKARGAPEDRPDRRHLGNARLISYWPVRGGPVLADGRIYIGAGIWPTLGVFIVAVDAKTGKVIWRNEKLNYIEKVRIDHNTLADAGISPQGYLVAVGDKLLVANGRSMPCGLDRKTGKLLFYVQGYRRGHCRVTAMGKYAFVGRQAVINTSDGREVGSRWKAAGKEAPQKFDLKKMHLFEGPMFGYKMFPACDANSALTPNVVYGMHRGVFYAYDLTKPKLSEYEKKFAGQTLKPWRWDLPELWRQYTKYSKKGAQSQVLIKAGDRLYGHANNVLIALDLPKDGGQPKIAWEKSLDGTPSSMAAADGKLFVATQEGQLYCFGGGEREPQMHKREVASPPRSTDTWTSMAKEVVSRANVAEGYCVVLGINNGRLIDALLQDPQVKVIAVDADAKKVHALRKKLVAAGVYGTRAEAFVGQPFDFPFPPYLACLVVSEDPKGAGFSTGMRPGELYNILRPYGGAACLKMPAPHQDRFIKWAKKAKLANAEIKKEGDFAVLRRVGPLPGSAWWTHETADAARTYFSKDQLVKAPLGILWYGDGEDYGFYKRKDYGIGVKPQVVGGRLYAFRISGQTLVSYDVYTGRQLWEQKVERYTRYVSMPDGIYVAGGNRCVVYDPATGKEIKTLTIDTEKPPVVKDIRLSDDVIVIAVAFKKAKRIEEGLWDSAMLIALDRKTGKTLWKKEAKERFNNNAIAACGGMVFCIDSLTPTNNEQAKRRGEEMKTVPSTIMALDARTGEMKWTAVTENAYRYRGTPGHWLGLRASDDWLAYAEEVNILLTGKEGQIRAFDTRTGRKLWEGKVGGQPMIVRGKTFLTQGGAIFNTKTGKHIRSIPFVPRGGCNYCVANKYLIFLRARSVAYFDIASGDKYYLRNIRSGCSNSLIAADGLLNVPNFAVGCVCNYPIQTSFAMMYMPEVKPWAGKAPIALPKDK